MFKFFRSRPDRLCIDRGRVPCPRRGYDVELDVCAACPEMREVVQEDATPYVRCRHERVRTLPELMALIG